LLDLGGALRNESVVASSKSWLTCLLSQLQAAFGAVCMAAAAFTVYHNAIAWASSTAQMRVLLAAYIFIGLLMVYVGFNYIRSAFASERKGGSGGANV
jgi:hypothetical protein